ncbi:protein Brevis radix-like 1 isoform X1 [Primulina huaijiensis]|uniref:protein Brevis radix-like 1 isoform X1 n=2 Tax=Primulina huaijiensis TaxID=1492673 RepID=UPI003CC6EDBC
MLTCVTCSKQRMEDRGDKEDEGYPPRETPNTKDTLKTLTSQIKDMAMKVSGSYKCKPGVQEEIYHKKGQKPYPDFDTISEGVPYPYMPPGSSNSSFGGIRTQARFESISARSGEGVLDEENGPKAWTAQVEPGVQITFLSLPRGGNDLKRIRFSREMFDKWQAQRWWGENYEKIMELYNVQRFNQQALNTPGRSEDGRDSTYSRLGSIRESPRMTPAFNRECTPRYKHFGDNLQHHNAITSGYTTGGPKGDFSSMGASRTTTSSKDEASVSLSNASDMDSEWIEEDEPGVYITIRQLVDGTRELRRVRFSRERFGEVHAKLWWETNRDRIQSQYLCQ